MHLPRLFEDFPNVFQDVLPLFLYILSVNFTSDGNLNISFLSTNTLNYKNMISKV